MTDLTKQALRKAVPQLSANQFDRVAQALERHPDDVSYPAVPGVAHNLARIVVDGLRRIERQRRALARELELDRVIPPVEPTRPAPRMQGTKAEKS